MWALEIGVVWNLVFINWTFIIWLHCRDDDADVRNNRVDSFLVFVLHESRSLRPVLFECQRLGLCWWNWRNNRATFQKSGHSFHLKRIYSDSHFISSLRFFCVHPNDWFPIINVYLSSNYFPGFISCNVFGRLCIVYIIIHCIRTKWKNLCWWF